MATYFRKWKDNGDIIALFPDDIANHRGEVLAYQHVGQHGAADYDYVISQTTPAKPSEYASLKRELEDDYSYKLKVYKRK